MAMNYIRHLTGFFDKVTDDRSLNPTHISLYIALFQFWNCNRFRNPISISRDEIMRISKISSKATYHKCLKELHSKEYIKYEPSFNPYKGSHVWLIDFADTLKPLGKAEQKSSDFSLAVKQVEGGQVALADPAMGQHTEQLMVPSINNTNTSNILKEGKGLNSETPKQIFQGKEITFEKKEEKSGAKKEERYGQPAPSLENVLAFFEDSGFPEVEANKFYNYFQSNGWLVGGKAPMADWQAASRNWMLNADFIRKDAPGRAKQLSVATDKNYFEPL